MKERAAAHADRENLRTDLEHASALLSRQGAELRMLRAQVDHLQQSAPRPTP